MLVAVEVICCLLLCSTFFWHAPLAQLGMPEGSGWTFIILILSLRIFSGLFGIWSACRRKVKQVRRHYYFIVVNLLLSLVIYRPLLLCDCFCFEPSMDLVMNPRSSVREAQQCDVWTSFEDVSSSRRLAVKGDEWPNCGQSELLVVPDLFKVSNVSLSGQRSCVELPFTQTWAIVLLEMDKGNVSNWDWSKLHLQDFHSALMTCFKLRRCGAIYLEVSRKTTRPASPTQSGSSYCGNINVCNFNHPVLPVLPDSSLLPASVDEQGQQGCLSQGWRLSLLKDMEKYECFRFRIGAVNGPATELCRLVVRGSILLLLLANVVAIPAIIVIRKFLENNCGDFIDTEEQFDVDCYTDSRFSIADSFVAGAYDATSYFRGAKDPFKPRSLNPGGSSVELSSRGAPSNWANQDGSAGI